MLPMLAVAALEGIFVQFINFLLRQTPVESFGILLGLVHVLCASQRDRTWKNVGKNEKFGSLRFVKHNQLTLTNTPVQRHRGHRYSPFPCDSLHHPQQSHHLFLVKIP